MEKVVRENIEINPINGFTFIGDPGCDGLGVEIMSIFNAACHEASGDFMLIGGDIVPNGTTHYYKNVMEMTDAVIDKPVYVLPGNHDTLDYESFFGLKNYFLYNSRLLIIVLDNSKRVFSQETLDLLQRALAYERDNIVLTFHIPPPNKITKNSVSTEEWDKVLTLISALKEKVKFILCGHIHSYFEDDVNGIKLIATGGGGARIEEVEGIEAPYYHFVEFSFDSNGVLNYSRKPVSFSKAPSVPLPVLKSLEKAFAGECQAYMRYRIYAEDALRNNKPGLAKLFYAASDSELYHARNFFYSMNHVKSSLEAVSESIANESEEINDIYLNALHLARQQGAGLAAYAFQDARSAESVHLRLFKEAESTLAALPDVPEKQYSTCTSCGYTITDIDSIKFCPVCGAPADKLLAVEKI
ncbi:MAG: metallophosphoesterase [Treponema sp.]|nr:metallophosphoesterase [Treponema sp.]